MKRCIPTLVAALALTLAIAGTASANPPPPGTPGEPNCQGHTTAFMSQRFANIGEPGLANTASKFDRTVKEEIEWIYTRCNP